MAPREAGLATATGVLQLATGIGMLAGRQWAWWTAVALTVFGIFRDGLRMVRGDTIAVVSVAFNAAILIYLVQRRVRAWFGLPGAV